TGVKIIFAGPVCASALPLSAYVGGIEFNGDGTTGDLLPGTTVNSFGCGYFGTTLHGAGYRRS
ncbi:MAG TPA: hypothetical protein VIX37_23460, partial [Candidatus Sulfotelmatobacter sp.]